MQARATYFTFLPFLVCLYMRDGLTDRGVRNLVMCVWVGVKGKWCGVSRVENTYHMYARSFKGIMSLIVQLHGEFQSSFSTRYKLLYVLILITRYLCICEKPSVQS